MSLPYSPYISQIDPYYAHYSPRIPASASSSPFIPPAHLYQQPSPFPSPAPDLPRRVHFEDEDETGVGLGPPPPRQRRPSWHGGISPLVQPQAQAYLSPQSISRSVSDQMHSRRHSFGNGSAQTGGLAPWFYHAQAAAGPQGQWLFHPSPSIFTSPLPPTLAHSPHHALSPLPPSPFPLSRTATSLKHPLLDATRPRTDFHFSLSSNRFSPLRLVPPLRPGRKGKWALLTIDDFKVPATHPPVKRLTIVHDDVAQWPVIVDALPPGQDAAGREKEAAVTLGDVLVALHRSLHTPILREEWEALRVREGSDGEARVSRNYAKRWRAAGTQVRWWEDRSERDILVEQEEERTRERNKGVKRVDFLRLGKGAWELQFKGCIHREGGGEVEMWTLVSG
jgi:hypothetical protein